VAFTENFISSETRDLLEPRLSNACRHLKLPALARALFRQRLAIHRNPNRQTHEAGARDDPFFDINFGINLDYFINDLLSIETC
jgi:hypothetical protein